MVITTTIIRITTMDITAIMATDMGAFSIT
jgi:hypothetical protein